MTGSKIPLLEFCEETQTYQYVNLNYPVCITVYEEGHIYLYVEKFNDEYMTLSDGTVMIHAMKQYQQLHIDRINNQSNNRNGIANNSQNTTKKVSHQKNARRIKKVQKKKSTCGNVLIDWPSTSRNSTFSKVCRFKCLLKVKRNDIQHLFGKYLALTAKEKQDYIQKLIVKQTLLDQDNQKVVYFYHIPLKSKLFKVCKSCFMKIFAINKILPSVA